VKFEVRELAAGETHELRRSVSADGRADLPTMHYELDDASDSWHLGAVDPSGRVVGISSFYREACPARPEVPESFQLQFMAVDPSVQREGIGSSILSEGLRRLQSMGAKLLWASARDNAVPFYERFGFEVVPDSASLPASTGRPHHLILLEIQQQERREVGGGDRAPRACRHWCCRPRDGRIAGDRRSPSRWCRRRSRR